MAKGLLNNWNQPVVAAFDAKMTLDILNRTMIAFYDEGFLVVNCISDCDGANKRL